MSRVLFIDTSSNCLDLAMRCQRAGHDVRWFESPYKDGTLRRAGDGIVTKISDWRELTKKWLDWADLIYLTDNALYMKLLEPYRLNGYPMFGGGIRAAELEINRMDGQAAMKKAGMNIIPGKEFHSYSDAIKYVEKEGKAYVSKPCWDAAKDLTYVAKDPDDLIFMLEAWNKNPEYRRMSKKHGFLLQEKVTGTEFAVGGFFGPNGWSKYFLENFEYKKLCNDDLGPSTGEMGNAAKAVKKSKLAEEVLLPMTAQLHEIGYIGYVDNNCIVDDAGKVWPLEFTIARDGCPIRFNRDALIEGDPIQWMIDLTNGVDSMQMKSDVCVSVVVVLPPFPNQHKVNKDLDGTPVWNAIDAEHVHPVEMRIEQNIPTWIDGKVRRLPGYVATDDYVCVVTGTGDTIRGARLSAYTATKKLKISRSPFYRTDIGAYRLSMQLPKLQKNGFAKDWKYS